jgi:hypothetical protein
MEIVIENTEDQQSVLVLPQHSVSKFELMMLQLKNYSSP